MKWQKITELPSELVAKDLLLRIETDDKGIIYSAGYVSDGFVYVFNYAGYDNRFDLKFFCNEKQLQRYGIVSIHYADPKGIELTK